MSIKSAQILSTVGNISYITANIDDVEYGNITPKIIQNNDVFTAVGKRATTLKEKTSAYILPGINCIDIDWNKANLSYTVGNTTNISYVSSTSDLLKIINKINSHVSTFNADKSQNLWEDIIGDATITTLVYEDINNNILPSFTALNIDDIIAETIAPFTADHVGAYSEDGKKQYALPLNSEYGDLSNTFGTRLYRVGLISDVSSMDTLNPDDDTVVETNEKLNHALSAFRSLNGLSFISSTGDILADNTDSELSVISECISKNNIDLYTCKGNTDNAACYYYDRKKGLMTDNTAWKKLIPNSLYDIKYFEAGDKTSFYFKKPLYTNNKYDVYIYVNVDFKNNRNTPTSEYFGIDVLEELQNILNENKDNRCFVFIHYPLSEEGAEFEILRKLNAYYKNSIWFSGHTHLQLNFGNIISNNNGTTAYNVHIPSLSNPVDNLGNSLDGSEAEIMDVYATGVNIRGIIFSDNQGNENVYCSSANYWIQFDINALTSVSNKPFKYFA